jgi:hypothetical protein
MHSKCANPEIFAKGREDGKAMIYKKCAISERDWSYQSPGRTGAIALPKFLAKYW